jgi:hypothetical protein
MRQTKANPNVTLHNTRVVNSGDTLFITDATITVEIKNIKYTKDGHVLLPKSWALSRMMERIGRLFTNFVPTVLEKFKKTPDVKVQLEGEYCDPVLPFEEGVKPTRTAPLFEVSTMDIPKTNKSMLRVKIIYDSVVIEELIKRLDQCITEAKQLYEQLVEKGDGNARDILTPGETLDHTFLGKRLDKVGWPDIATVKTVSSIEYNLPSLTRAAENQTELHIRVQVPGTWDGIEMSRLVEVIAPENMIER